MSKKIKLVLSGSGTRYPCFVGAIIRLLKEDLEIEEVCGTSGGAIVAAGLGAYYIPDNHKYTSGMIKQLCFDVLPKNLLDPRIFGITWGTNGLFKGNKILKEMSKRYPTSFKDTSIPINIVTYNNNRSQHKIWSIKDDIDVATTVRASMSIPILFDAVKINNDIHTDGGITANFPIDYFTEGNVVGLTFLPDIPEERKEIRTKIDLIQSHINGAINNSMKEDISDVNGRAKIIYIDTKHPGLDLFMSELDVVEQINDGYESVDSWLKTNKLF